MKAATLILTFLMLTLGIMTYRAVKINADVITAKKIFTQNRELIKKQKQYEQYFLQLDSIYSMERQIQNILNTYYENNPEKVKSIIDKNRLQYVSDIKTKLDLQANEENKKDEKEVEKIPDILPVIGTVSKKYSEETHDGIDFAAKEGDPIFASASGKISFSENKGDLGLTIIINHGNGYESSYSHLKKSYVKRNDFVKKGQTIGSIGSTGNSTGPHLHYEIKYNSQNIDPESLFNQ